MLSADKRSVAIVFLDSSILTSKQLGEMQKREASARGEASALKDHVATLDSELRAGGGRLSAMTSENDSLKVSNASLSADLAQLHRESEILGGQLRSLSDEKNRTSDEVRLDDFVPVQDTHITHRTTISIGN